VPPVFEERYSTESYLLADSRTVYMALVRAWILHKTCIYGNILELKAIQLIFREGHCAMRKCVAGQWSVRTFASVDTI
jgi:hypothetical protein